MSESNIKTILQIDSEHRYEDVSDDLFTLHDLSNVSTWNYSLPTLMKNISEYTNRKNIVRNNNTFKNNFYEKYYYLNGINLSNMLIAGGCIRKLLVNDNSSDSKDVDIFLYGIDNISDAKKRIEKFILDVYENIKLIHNGYFVKEELKELTEQIKRDQSKKFELEKEFKKKHKLVYNPDSDETGISIVNNGNTITMILDGAIIQFILRLYNTKSSILHGFDLGSSAVGFDGKNVYFTTLSKFCYENMVNIIDCTRRSTTYEHRLIKYFNYGFDIIMPNFDITQLSSSYHKYNLVEVCEMPYLIFSYRNIKGNCIQLENFYNSNGNFINNDGHSDYNIYEIISGDDIYEIFYFNIKKLIKHMKNTDIPLNVIQTIDLSDELETFDSKKINIREWKITFNNNFINPKMLETLYNTLAKEFFDNINLKKISNYISIVKAEKFISDVYINTKTNDEKNSKITYYIEEQKKNIKNFIEEIKCELKWITKNPTTQLTSSCNPIIEDESKWYGKYYNNDVKETVNNTTLTVLNTSFDEEKKSDNNQTDISNYKEEDKSDVQPDDKSDGQPEDKSDDEPDDKSDDQQEDKSDDEPEDKSDDKSDGQPEDKSDDQPDDTSDDEQEDKSDDEQEDKSDDQPEDKSDDEQKDKSDDQPDDKSDDEPEDKPSVKSKYFDISESDSEDDDNASEDLTDIPFMVKFIDNKDVKYKGHIYGKNMDEIKKSAYNLVIDSKKFTNENLKKGINFSIINVETEVKTKHTGKVIKIIKGRDSHTTYESNITDN